MVWLSLKCLETVSWSVNAEKRVYTLQVNWPPFCDRCLALGLRLDVPTPEVCVVKGVL